MAAWVAGSRYIPEVNLCKQYVGGTLLLPPTSLPLDCHIAGVMPVKNQLVPAGRYDIARAVEKWGGVAEVAERLGYAIGLGGKEQWYSHVKQVAREKGLSGSEVR